MEEKEERAGVKRAVKTTPASPPGRAGTTLRRGPQSAVHARLQHVRRCIFINPRQAPVPLTSKSRKAQSISASSQYFLAFQIRESFLTEKPCTRSLWDSGLSVNKGEVQPNQRTPSAGLAACNFTVACLAVRSCD